MTLIIFSLNFGGVTKIIAGNPLEKMGGDLCYKKDGVLGFKDANMFNIILLAKQWWHLIHLDSLLNSRILRAKYCLGGPLSITARGNHDSFIWFSLLVGKIVVGEGSIWRVWDDTNIDIWSNKWLPKPPTYKVTPLTVDASIVPVASLIDGENHQ